MALALSALLYQMYIKVCQSNTTVIEHRKSSLNPYRGWGDLGLFIGDEFTSKLLVAQPYSAG